MHLELEKYIQAKLLQEGLSKFDIDYIAIDFNDIGGYHLNAEDGLDPTVYEILEDLMLGDLIYEVIKGRYKRSNIIDDILQKDTSVRIKLPWYIRLWNWIKSKFKR
jgi:hypothetical protein